MEKSEKHKTTVAILIFILMFFTVSILSPSPAYSDWRDSVNNFKNSSVQKARQSKKNISNNYKKKKKNYSENFRQTRKKTTKKIKRTTNSSIKKYQKTKTGFNNKYRQTVNSGKGYYSKQKSSVQKIGSKTFSNLNKRIDNAANYSKNTSKYIKKSVGGLNTRSREAVVRYLEKTKKAGSLAVERSMPLIKRVNKSIHDPATRERVTTGVLVASATGLAVYQKKDEIQYKIVSETMANVKVPVNGRMTSVESIYRDAVLQRAPYLRGTDIAEDPAKLIAYGVATTAKDDLLNNINCMPDGKGRLVSINDAVVHATGAEEGLAALQVGDAMESLAVDAAKNGKVGYEAQVFATAYADASETIESGAK